MTDFIRFSFSVKDGKNAGSDIDLYCINDNFTVGEMQAAALSMIPIVRNIMVGGVIESRVSFDVDTAALYTSFPSIPTPEEYADVEEKGVFKFLTESKVNFTKSIPCFDETLVLTGTKNLDLSDLRVAAFLTMMLEGIDVGAVFEFCDSYAERLQIALSGTEEFVPRKRKRRGKSS